MAGLLDTVTGALTGGNVWGSLIGGAINAWQSGKESDKNVASAQAYRDDLKSATRPISVYGPMAGATYDDETRQYGLNLSPEQRGLFNAYLHDIYRQRALVEPYMRDPEAAAKQRYAETTAAITPGREAATETLLSRLNKGGLLGSTVGAGMAAEVDTQRALEDAQRMGLARSGVQADITNYLNRSNSARAGMLGIGALPQSLATIGTGLVPSQTSAAYYGGTPLMNAKVSGASTSAQPFYQIGDWFSGLNKEETPTAIPGLGTTPYGGGWYPGAQ